MAGGGDGAAAPLVVLVHGSPGAPRNWDGVRRALAEHGIVDVVAVAIPGWDQPAPQPVEPLRFDAIIARLVAQVERPRRAPVDGPGGGATAGRSVVLVGFSAGAWFALGAAATAAWDLRALVLLDPMVVAALAAAGMVAEHELVRSTLETYFDATDAGSTDAIGPALDLWYAPGAYAAMPGRVKAWMAAWAPLNARDGRAALAADLDVGFLAGLDVPAVITWGGAGGPIWERFATAVAGLLPQAEVRRFAGADHALLDTHPAEVAELVATVVRAAAPGAGPRRG